MVNLDSFGSDGTALRDACLTGEAVSISTAHTAFSMTVEQVPVVLGHLRKILPDAPITINLPEMDLVLPGILAGSSCGHNITIAGALMESLTITAAVCNVSASGAHQVTFTMVNSSGFVVGGFAFVKSVIGTGREKVVEGCWEVLAKPSQTEVTLKITARKAALPSLSGLTDGRIRAARTVIRVNDAIGISVEGRAGNFHSIALVGNGAAGLSGVVVRKSGYAGFAEKGSVYPFGVTGFADHGFYVIENSYLSCFDAFSSGNGQSGINVTDGRANAVRLIATGNGDAGAVVTVGSVGGCSQGNFSGNGQRGLFGSSKAYAPADSALILENAGNGIRADNDAFVNATNSKVSGNVGFGVRAYGGHVYASGVDYTGGNGSGADNVQVQFGGRVDTSSTSYVTG